MLSSGVPWRPHVRAAPREACSHRHLGTLKDLATAIVQAQTCKRDRHGSRRRGEQTPARHSRESASLGIVSAATRYDACQTCPAFVTARGWAISGQQRGYDGIWCTRSPHLEPQSERTVCAGGVALSNHRGEPREQQKSAASHPHVALCVRKSAAPQKRGRHQPARGTPFSWAARSLGPRGRAGATTEPCQRALPARPHTTGTLQSHALSAGEPHAMTRTSKASKSKHSNRRVVAPATVSSTRTASTTVPTWAFMPSRDGHLALTHVIGCPRFAGTRIKRPGATVSKRTRTPTADHVTRCFDDGRSWGAVSLRSTTACIHDTVVAVQAW